MASRAGAPKFPNPNFYTLLPATYWLLATG